MRELHLGQRRVAALLLVVWEVALFAATFWLFFSYDGEEPFTRFRASDAWYYLVWGSALLGARVPVAILGLLKLWRPRALWLPALYLAWSLVGVAANFSCVKEFMFDVEKYQVSSAA